MYRKDFLDKQIEQLGRVLAKLLSDLIGLKEPGQGTALTNEVLKHELKLDLTDLLVLSNEELVEKLLETQQFDSGNFEKLADAWAQLAQNENANRQSLFQKSLFLYQHVDHSTRIFSAERQAKIDRINQLLKPV